MISTTKNMLFPFIIFGFMSFYSFGQIDLAMFQLIEPTNDTIDFSAEYTVGCFSPEVHIFTFGSGTISSDEITVCWSVYGGTPDCMPYSNIHFSIGWGINLQPTYWDTICVNPCEAVELVCYVTHPNDPNHNNDTLRVILIDQCVFLNTEEQTNKLFNSFPNPVKNKLNIELIGDIETLNIFSADGKIIQTIKNPNSAELIVTKNYAPGVYFLSAVSNNNKYTKKFIKN